MGKYHKQENQYIHRPKEKVWRLLYRRNKRQNRTRFPRTEPQVTLPLWTPPIPHQALSEEAHLWHRVPVLTDHGRALYGRKLLCAVVRERRKVIFPGALFKSTSNNFPNTEACVWWKGSNSQVWSLPEAPMWPTPAPKALRDRPQPAPELPQHQVPELPQGLPWPFRNSFPGFEHWKREMWLAGISLCQRGCSGNPFKLIIPKLCSNNLKKMKAV